MRNVLKVLHCWECWEHGMSQLTHHAMHDTALQPALEVQKAECSLQKASGALEENDQTLQRVQWTSKWIQKEHFPWLQLPSQTLHHWSCHLPLIIFTVVSCTLSRKLLQAQPHGLIAQGEGTIGIRNRQT